MRQNRIALKYKSSFKRSGRIYVKPTTVTAGVQEEPQLGLVAEIAFSFIFLTFWYQKKEQVCLLFVQSKINKSWDVGLTLKAESRNRRPSESSGQ